MRNNESSVPAPGNSQSGFGLAEFLMATLILLITASLVYRLIVEVQRSTGYQTEVQSVLNNTRIAIQTAGRYIRQAGNDPEGSGLAAITIISPTEVRIQSDLTGSGSPANPDKGDPDGDTMDPYEDVTLRYNGMTRSLEIVPDSGPAQVIAGYLSGLSFRYYDAEGRETATGNDVRKINVRISGSSLLPDPQTGKIFGIQVSSDFRLAADKQGYGI
jgi:hypothetical protein